MIKNSFIIMLVVLVAYLSYNYMQTAKDLKSLSTAAANGLNAVSYDKTAYDNTKQIRTALLGLKTLSFSDASGTVVAK